jgi:hypothetical protein
MEFRPFEFWRLISNRKGPSTCIETVTSVSIIRLPTLGGERKTSTLQSFLGRPSGSFSTNSTCPKGAGSVHRFPTASYNRQPEIARRDRRAPSLHSTGCRSALSLSRPRPFRFANRALVTSGIFGVPQESRASVCGSAAALRSDCVSLGASLRPPLHFPRSPTADRSQNPNSLNWGR